MNRDTNVVLKLVEFFNWHTLFVDNVYLLRESQSSNNISDTDGFDDAIESKRNNTLYSDAPLKKR